MNGLSKHKTGFAAGAFLGLWHFVWVLIVAAGQGQAFLDWVFSIHFIVTSFSVTSFKIMPAVLLVSFAFFAGYGAGWLFAAVWNFFHEEPEVLRK